MTESVETKVAVLQTDVNHVIEKIDNLADSVKVINDNNKEILDRIDSVLKVQHSKLVELEIRQSVHEKKIEDTQRKVSDLTSIKNKLYLLLAGAGAGVGGANGVPLLMKVMGILH